MDKERESPDFMNADEVKEMKDAAKKVLGKKGINIPPEVLNHEAGFEPDDEHTIFKNLYSDLNKGSKSNKLNEVPSSSVLDTIFSGGDKEAQELHDENHHLCPDSERNDDAQEADGEDSSSTPEANSLTDNSQKFDTAHQSPSSLKSETPDDQEHSEDPATEYDKHLSDVMKAEMIYRERVNPDPNLFSVQQNTFQGVAQALMEKSIINAIYKVQDGWIQLLKVTPHVTSKDSQETTSMSSGSIGGGLSSSTAIEGSMSSSTPSSEASPGSSKGSEGNKPDSPFDFKQGVVFYKEEDGDQILIDLESLGVDEKDYENLDLTGKNKEEAFLAVASIGVNGNFYYQILDLSR